MSPSSCFLYIYFLWFHAGGILSTGRKQNSNAFIKTIKEGEEGCQRREFSILSPNLLLFVSPSKDPASTCKFVCTCVCVDRWVHGYPGSSKDPPLHVSGVGVLIKGLSSLCLPGSSSLTRGLRYQRGAAQRG